MCLNRELRPGSVAGVWLATMLLASPPAAHAQVASAYRFDLDGLSLDEALQRYGRITGRQLIYRSETIGRRQAVRLVGTFDADRALRRLLDGVPVRVQQVRAGVIVILPVSASSSEIDLQASVDQLDDVQPAPANVVVTGTIIRGAGPAGVAVTTIGRRDIERSTRSSVSDFIATIPQNTGSTGSDAAVLGTLDRSSLNYSLSASPNLRGLGSDATLTLVNGRRQAGSGGRGNFTDLSAVPLAAVERIEIVKDGASAIYGSDAVGGVVNVILKDDFVGLNTRLRSGVGSGGTAATAQFSQLAGTRWGGGGVLVAYEFDRRDALASADRDITRTADLRRFGGSDWRSFNSSPGTILRFDPTARAFVPAFAIPATTDRPSRQDFVPGRNLENQYALTDSLPLQERHSIYARATQRLFGNAELFAEGRWARRNFAYALPPAASTFSVSAANPYFVNPDGSSQAVIAYSFGDDLGAGQAEGRVNADSLVGGVTVELGGDWQLDAYYLSSRERSADESRNLLNSTALAEALGNSRDNPSTSFVAARDGFFNPYGSGLSNDRAILEFIGSGRSGTQRRSTLKTAVAKLDGKLVRLPAGPLRIALGGAWRHDTLASSGFNFTSGTAPLSSVPTFARRSLGATFGELSAPVFDQSGGVGFGRLAVSAAARFERYSDFGDTTNPKIGATWSFGRLIELRGSWGTSFRAPALPEVRDVFRVAPSQLSTQGGTNVPVLFMSGGNPGLRPETAETVTVGLTMKPLSRVKIDVGYFRTSFLDRIGRPGLQNAVRALVDPTLSPFVRIVDPVGSPADLAAVQALLADPGAIDAGVFPATSYRAIVDGRYVNTSRVDVEGVDVSAAASADVWGGRLSAGVDAAYLLRYDQRLTPTAAVMDMSSTLGFPAKFKARSTIDFSGGAFGATLSSSFVGSYRNIDTIQPERVGTWLTFDLQLRSSIGSATGFQIALDARNLFDRAPPFVNRSTGVGYDPANSDVLGRVVAVQISRSW